MSLNSSPKSYPFSILKNLFLMATGSTTLILLGLFLGGWGLGSRILSGINAFFNAPPPTPKVEVSSLIFEQIRGLSQLTTAVFVMDAVVPTSQERKLGNLVVGKTKLLYIARGEVRAGIDLTALNSNHIKIDDQNVHIQLPPPEILDHKIDVEQSKVYDYDRGFLGLGPDVAPQLQTLAQQSTLDKIMATACNKGILDEANQRAQLAVTQLLTTAGYDHIKVIATPPNSNHCPISTAVSP
ncbi:MAG TPA: DUF4230 domain-containing protein [Cyanothece sp. UBA12306]|nr:DUF4230 domain-containing protein [Cyanothece sp. UBA12306]